MKTRIVLALLAASALGVAPALAATENTGNTEKNDDQAPRLSVNARILRADGSSHQPARNAHPMVSSTAVTSFMFAGPDLCSVGGAEANSSRKLDDLIRDKAHVWKIVRTGVGHADGKLTFDLEWSRYDGTPKAAASGKQRLTLAEGASYPLDMVRPSQPGPCGAAAAMIEIEAGATEAAEFADTVLTYDLWLTHQDGSGKKQTRHFVVSAKQGAAMPFEFSPLRFDMPALVANQFDLDLVTRVEGAVRGRQQDSRKVTLELDTKRMDRLEIPGDPTMANPRAAGRKVLDVTLGETVEIELPRTTGFVARNASPDARGFSGPMGVSASAGTSPAAPAVSLSKDGQLVVSFKEFFADDRFSVMVRVRKAE